jgi:hypothetical protein
MVRSAPILPRSSTVNSGQSIRAGSIRWRQSGRGTQQECSYTLLAYTTSVDPAFPDRITIGTGADVMAVVQCTVGNQRIAPDCYEGRTSIYRAPGALPGRSGRLDLLTSPTGNDRPYPHLGLSVAGLLILWFRTEFVLEYADLFRLPLRKLCSEQLAGAESAECSCAARSVKVSFLAWVGSRKTFIARAWSHVPSAWACGSPPAPVSRPGSRSSLSRCIWSLSWRSTVTPDSRGLRRADVVRAAQKFRCACERDCWSRASISRACRRL